MPVYNAYGSSTCFVAFDAGTTWPVVMPTSGIYAGSTSPGYVHTVVLTFSSRGAGLPTAVSGYHATWSEVYRSDSAGGNFAVWVGVNLAVTQTTTDDPVRVTSTGGAPGIIRQYVMAHYGGGSPIGPVAVGATAATTGTTLASPTVQAKAGQMVLVDAYGADPNVAGYSFAVNPDYPDYQHLYQTYNVASGFQAKFQTPSQTVPTDHGATIGRGTAGPLRVDIVVLGTADAPQGALANAKLADMSDSYTLDLSKATYVATDPATTAAPANSPSYWYRFTPWQDANFTITITASAAAKVELYSGPSTVTTGSDLTRITSTHPRVLSGAVYYLRIIALDAAATVNLNWSSLPGDPIPDDPPPPSDQPNGGGDVLVEVTSDVDTTPTWVRVNITNGAPNDTVDLTLDDDSTVLLSVDLDASGQAIGISVPLDELEVGDHVLRTGVAEATFSVLSPPVAYPEARVPDAAPQPPEVARWALQNPGPGGSTYVFPINPARMSSPHAARVFTTEHTTAPDGQPLTFEGSPVGVDWSFEGTVLTESFYDSLDAFMKAGRRLYLFDHLQRCWEISLEDVAWEVMRSSEHPWAHRYKAKAIIYGQVL